MHPCNCSVFCFLIHVGKSLYEYMYGNWFDIFRVAQKREDAVSKEVTRKLSEADNRKMSRKEKDERSVRLQDDNVN